MRGVSVLLLVGLNAFTACVSGSAVIDSHLQKRLALGETQNVMVSFTQNIQTVFEKINKMNFSSSGEKRTALTNAQETFTNGAQKPLQTFLNSAGVPHESFWISNTMSIRNVNSALAQSISSVPGVAKIEKDPVFNVALPWGIDEPVEDLHREARQSSNSYGIDKIRAPQAWASSGKGKGIVVASIDTGVRYTHETLKGRWRTSYGWLDPYDEGEFPVDEDGHGTHTMGTIAGTNGIGVAPEATWIACRGCNSDGCAGSALTKCGQWVQCPYRYDGTSRNCYLAPDVVSNSWGTSGGQTFYNTVIDSWRTADIVPVFSAGNSGPNCNTLGSPGDQPKVIGVGSTDSGDRISGFSSLGPTTTGKVKPDIVAPGSAVRSAWYTSDTAYATLQGTSMACPHVTGVVALMLQKNYNSNYDKIYTAITTKAARKTLSSNAKTCGGKSPTTWPNNVYGYGRIDAVDALSAV